jgi:hypothetical protein
VSLHSGILREQDIFFD